LNVLGFKVPGFRVFKIFKNQVFEVSRFQARFFWFQYEVYRILGTKVFRFLGIKVSVVQECKIPCFEVFRNQGFEF
jgi:hypothetical protein